MKDSNKNQWQPKNDKCHGFVPRKNYWPNQKTWEGKGKQSVWSGQGKEKELNSPSLSVANVVSTSFESFVIDTYNQAYRDSSLFTAGQIQHCKDQWVQITSDREILQMVNG